MSRPTGDVQAIYQRRGRHGGKEREKYIRSVGFEHSIMHGRLITGSLMLELKRLLRKSATTKALPCPLPVLLHWKSKTDMPQEGRVKGRGETFCNSKAASPKVFFFFFRLRLATVIDNESLQLFFRLGGNWAVWCNLRYSAFTINQRAPEHYSPKNNDSQVS